MTGRRIIGETVVTVAVGLAALGANASARAQSQETDPSEGFLPVRVETLELEPTVVKTGDRITQTYRVRFPDLIDQGQEIIILEDRMVPENLPVHPFEGVSLAVEKRQLDDEHIWDFVYGFRLVSPEKATYVLPGFSFYYLVRDLGEDVEEAEVQQVDGGAGLVGYVTTITEVPVLDVRDTIELGSFAGRAATFRTLAWTVAPLPLLVWFVMLVRLARCPKVVTEAQQREADEIERLEAQIPAPPSVWQARRNLRRQLRSLEGLMPSDNGTTLRDVERSIVITAREYLQAELPDLDTGDTPKDIAQHVAEMKDGARKEALRTLTSRLVDYQSGLEQESLTAIDDPAAEARVLQDSLTQLRPHMLLWTSIKGFFGAG